MVTGIESKPEQKCASGQRAIGYAAPLNYAFTSFAYRGHQNIGPALVLADHFREFDNSLRGKVNPAYEWESDLAGPKFDSCRHEKSIGVRV